MALHHFQGIYVHSSTAENAIIQEMCVCLFPWVQVLFLPMGWRGMLLRTHSTL